MFAKYGAESSPEAASDSDPTSNLESSTALYEDSGAGRPKKDPGQIYPSDRKPEKQNESTPPTIEDEIERLSKNSYERMASEDFSRLIDHKIADQEVRDRFKKWSKEFEDHMPLPPNSTEAKEKNSENRKEVEILYAQVARLLASTESSHLPNTARAALAEKLMQLASNPMAAGPSKPLASVMQRHPGTTSKALIDFYMIK